MHLPDARAAVSGAATTAARSITQFMLPFSAAVLQRMCSTLSSTQPRSALAQGQPLTQPQLQQQLRGLASAHPEIQVYAGPQPPRKAVTLRTLRGKYERGEPIVMCTAYDYPSAVHVRSRCAYMHVGNHAGLHGPLSHCATSTVAPSEGASEGRCTAHTLPITHPPPPSSPAANNAGGPGTG